MQSNLIQSRQTHLQTALHSAGFDALVLNPGPSLTYLTGLEFHLSERPVVAAFFPEKPPFIVLPELETAKVRHLDYDLQSFPYQEDPAAWLDVFRSATEHARLRGGRIGLEPVSMRFLELDLLQNAIPSAEFLSADDVIASLRMIKDQIEVDYMQQAVYIAQNALQATLPFIKPGLTEKAVALELSIQLIKHGSNPYLPFSPIVSSGSNSANPHASPSDRPLQEGDLLVIDYGANVGGYFSDITRTFAIGTVDPKYHHIAEVVLLANQAGRDAVRPGATAASVDQASRSVIETYGYGQYFFHRTGHGLGLQGHEPPYIRLGNPLQLQPGMTFTIEPGIYLPDENGVRIEDNIVVTPDGARTLTTLPRNLITLPL
jgi:Xaa-Pro dipeptidase